MGQTKYKKLLVFGGTGFLGNSLIKLLENNDAKITLFTRNTNLRNASEKYKANPNIKITNWDVTNQDLIEENVLRSLAISIKICETYNEI